MRRGRPVEQGPAAVDPAPPAPGPFEIAHRDAPQQAALDGADHLRVAQGGDVAVALDAQLLEVHRAGDVDGQHQLDVDLGRVLCGQRARRQRRGDGEQQGGGEARGFDCHGQR